MNNSIHPIYTYSLTWKDQKIKVNAIWKNFKHLQSYMYKKASCAVMQQRVRSLCLVNISHVSFFFSPLFNGFSTKRKKKIGIISGDSCTNNFLHFNNLQKPRRRRLLHNIENGKWPEARFFKVPEMFWARKAIFNGLYLKTERCIRLKPLVWREPLLILRIC